MSIFVLEQVGFNPVELFNRAERARRTSRRSRSARARSSRARSTRSRSGLALVLGTAGPAAHPHAVLHRPDAKAARTSVVWAIFIIGAFYILTTFIGFGARAFLGEDGVEAAGTGGNLAAPNLAQFLGGGEGTFGGDLFLAVIAAVAFATILAVVAGLVLSASGAVAHDMWSNVIRKGRDSEHEEVLVARIAAASIGAIAIAHRDHRRRGAERLVHGRPRVRRGGERELPGAAARADVAAVQHRRRGHRRAVRRRQLDRPRDHLAEGLAGAGRRGRRAVGFYDLANPGIISIPLGFIGCWLGTMLSTERGNEREFDELHVRSETGLGAERAGLAA